MRDRLERQKLALYITPTAFETLRATLVIWGIHVKCSSSISPKNTVSLTWIICRLLKENLKVLLYKDRKTSEMIINHKGTRMVKDGKDWHGLQATKLKSLAKLFKPFNRDCAPLSPPRNWWYISPELISLSTDGWSPSQGFVTPSIKAAGTRLDTWVERGSARVQC